MWLKLNKDDLPKIFRTSFKKKRKLVLRRIKERKDEELNRLLFGYILFGIGAYLLKDLPLPNDEEREG